MKKSARFSDEINLMLTGTDQQKELEVFFLEKYHNCLNVKTKIAYPFIQIEIELNEDEKSGKITEIWLVQSEEIIEELYIGDLENWQRHQLVTVQFGEIKADGGKLIRL